MKVLKQRIAKAFGGGTSERGTSNLEIVVWMSVVLVIAVGLFFLRDNIAKFINNAATQIASEESGDSLNEYGFEYGKRYYFDANGITYFDGWSFIPNEDGTVDMYTSNGSYLGAETDVSYSDGTVIYGNQGDASTWLKFEMQPNGNFKLTDGRI